VHSNLLRVTAPTFVPPKPPDYRLGSWNEYLDFLRDLTGGYRGRGTYEPRKGLRCPSCQHEIPYAATSKEAAFREARRATGEHAFKALDIDSVFAPGFDGKAVAEESFKCGAEAPSNGWHLKTQLSGSNPDLLFIETRQVDGDAAPEDSAYEVTVLRQPLQVGA